MSSSLTGGDGEGGPTLASVLVKLARTRVDDGRDDEDSVEELSVEERCLDDVPLEGDMRG